MKALILAAGKGTRISHLTRQRPKPMLPVAGRPLLEHLVCWLSHYGITSLAINLHHLPAVITEHFGTGQQLGVNITYSYEPQLLGTAGAAKQLSSFLNETFIVVYGDVFTNLDLSRLVRFHEERRSAGAVLSMALYHAPNPTECGLVQLGEDGRVQCFVEKPPAHEVFSDLANSGIFICEPEVLSWIPPGVVFDFGRDLLPRLLTAAAPIYGLTLEPDEFVVDIGTPAGLERVQRVKANRRLALTRCTRSHTPGSTPGSIATGEDGKQ